jgi:uncharacterized protein YdcH (DUF465 family)
MDQRKGGSLEACRDTVRRLQRENAQLRRVADAFGELAERISHVLRKQKRDRSNGLHVSRK